MDELLEQTIRDAFPDLPLPEQPLTTHRCSECDEVDAVLVTCPPVRYRFLS
jgi:hypothetical protein